MIPAETVLFAGWEENHALEYVRDNGFTRDDVRVVRKEDGQILVIAKRDCEWPNRKAI